MKLNGKKWENYSTPYIDTCNKSKYISAPELETFSLGELKEKVDWLIHNEEINHKDIYEVPVFIEYNNSLHLMRVVSSGVNHCTFGTDKGEKLIFTAPDSRPEVGEYWKSRGVSIYDCSGFVVSKLAGERLLRLVKYVLETDTPKSWLDFRENEPNWIQFKFKKEEFDLEKLDKLSKEANGIITEEILRKCKL